ncbi:MAG: DUF4440 domain-containing protein [Gemmatimonadetes bacterium]|nr:DUF4440 domain-containing protein [Gemmatimonadota bacterium]
MSTIPGRNPATLKWGSVGGTLAAVAGLFPGLGRIGTCLVALVMTSMGAAAGQSTAEPQANQSDEVARVEAVAEALLRGISEGNAELLDGVLHPDAYLMAVPDEGTARRQERAEFIRSVGDSGGRYLERMWEPRTEVSGPVATVWTPYDFHIDGQFSHCGIDAFQLIRQDDRWVVLSVVYTMRRGDDCDPSPLGPPAR